MVSSELLAQPASSAITSNDSPIRKVITLIEEMKAQVQKDAKADEAAFGKYTCWCDTNEKEKKEAIAFAAGRIAELEGFLEESAAKEAELKIQIAGLEADIAADNEALASATSVREKENTDFRVAEDDMKETIGLLRKAIAVLSKVQLAQKGKSGFLHQAQVALLQVRKKATHLNFPKFQSIMQKDLFDMLGSLEDAVEHHARSGSFLAERHAGSLLPWEKTEEQVGMESNPNSLQGQAAGAKSYNSRSGQILGILDEMLDEFARDLSTAQKAEFQQLVDFNKLRAAKMAEIAAATKQKKMKESALADLVDSVAKAKEDLANMKEAKAADEDFLANLLKNCKAEQEAFDARAKIRADEVVALSETLTILTSDDARDLFGRSVGTSFLQVSRSSAIRERLTDNAVKRLMKIAKKSNNWSLMSLAVHVRLDAFTKVKEAMDKMLAELKKQQAEEYEKVESCKKNIDETEDFIKEGENTKEDLGEKNKMLTNSLAQLKTEIENLQQEVADMEVNLKSAGEARREENQLFQAQISDQRATINILEMAKTRLQQFYTPKMVSDIQLKQPVPGAAAPPPPPKASVQHAYSKSGGSGGVIQLLMKIIADAAAEEKALQVSENNAQKNYADYTRATTDNIEADRRSVAEAKKHVAETDEALSETKQSQLANEVSLEKLNGLLAGHHTDCDYFLKYFDVRQKTRAEEMDAIQEAKAILSGADFGK